MIYSACLPSIMPKELYLNSTPSQELRFIESKLSSVASISENPYTTKYSTQAEGLSSNTNEVIIQLLEIEGHNGNPLLSLPCEEKSTPKMLESFLMINSPCNSHSELYFEPGTTPHVYATEDNDIPSFRNYSVYNIHYKNHQAKQQHNYKKSVELSKNLPIKKAQDHVDKIMVKKIKTQDGYISIQNLIHSSSHAQLKKNAHKINDAYLETYKHRKQNLMNFIKVLLKWFINHYTSDEISPLLSVFQKKSEEDESNSINALFNRKESYALKDLRFLCYEKENSEAFRVILIDYLETKFEYRLSKSRVSRNTRPAYLQMKDSLICILKSNNSLRLENLN